jgi:hypothetical protein
VGWNTFGTGVNGPGPNGPICASNRTKSVPLSDQSIRDNTPKPVPNYVGITCRALHVCMREKVLGVHAQFFCDSLIAQLLRAEGLSVATIKGNSRPPLGATGKGAQALLRPWFYGVTPPPLCFSPWPSPCSFPAPDAQGMAHIHATTAAGRSRQRTTARGARASLRRVQTTRCSLRLCCTRWRYVCECWLLSSGNYFLDSIIEGRSPPPIGCLGGGG